MEAKDYVDLLTKHNLTQTQIAALIDTDQGTISKIQRGAVKDVMSKTYRALQALAGRVVAGEKVAA